MANLIIDIGNTRIKLAFFESIELIQSQAFDSMEELLIRLEDAAFEHCIISSVKYSEDELKTYFKFDFLFLAHQTKIPIENKYGSPHSLGLDRIAAAIGAWTKGKGHPILSIDLGSCITYDFVDESGAYLGGAISPGLSMRARAMHEFTARLPLVKLDKQPQDLIGNSTISCMEIGVWHGVVHEILGQIKAYQQKYPQIMVFVCGGDAQSFDSLVKDHIFVVPNLVLHGLNAILNHNVE